MSARSPLVPALAALLALASGCQRVGGALAVKVHPDPALVADCLKVTVLDGTTPLRWAVMPRPAGQADALVAVVRTQEMPATVNLQASAWLGTCTDEASLQLAGRGAAVAATFPESEVLAVALAVGPPGPDLDQDRDGWVAAAAGGPDCDDANPAIHPGATQDCGSLQDANCDGQVACADPTCGSSLTCAAPPDRLTLAGLPAAGLSGDCVGPVTVGLANVQGARAAVADTAVTLEQSGVSATGGAGCTGAPLAQLTIPFLGTSAQVWLRLGTPGAASLRATSPGLVAAEQQLTVQPNPVTALSLSGAPAALRAGECSGPVTVTLQGARGPTSVPAGSSYTVSLGAQPQDPAGNFFAAADCSLPALTSLTIASGAGSATFRVRAARTPTLQVTASGPGGVSAQASVAVSAGPAAQVAFLNQPLGLRTSDACSTARGALLQLETRDALGNAAPAGSSVKLALSSTAPPLTFSQADAGASPCAVSLTEVTIPQGASRVDVALKVSGVGTGTVTATPNLAGFAPVSQAYTVAAGEPVQLAFTSAQPQTPLAGQCTPADLVLEARDSSGTASSFATTVPVQLSRSGGAVDPRFAFYGQAGCAQASALDGGVLPFLAGQSQARFFFRGEKTSTFGVVATPQAAGVTGATLAGNQVRAGPPASLVWAAPATASAVAGTCAAPLTLQVQDAFANPTSFAAAQAFTVSSVPAGATFGLTAGQCQAGQPFTLAAGAQSTPVAARATATGGYALSALAGTVATAAAATFTVTPGTGILSVTPAGPLSLVAGACQQLSYALADSLGNPVPAGASGDTLAFSALPSGVSVHGTLADCQAGANAGTGFPVAAGASGRLVWVRGTVASGSAVVVTATLGGSPVALSLSVSPDTAASLTFQGLPASQPSGACSGALAVRRLDRFGNLAVAGPASAGVSGGSLAYTASTDCSGTAGPSTSITFAPGASSSSAFSLSGTTAGVTTVTADAGTLGVSASYTVTPGPPAQLRFTSPVGTAVAGVCAGPLVLQVRDAAGNPTTASGLSVALSSSPDAVTFYGDGTCGAALGGPVSLTGSTATLSFRASKAPALETLTATAAALPSSDFQVWSVGLGPPAALAWTAPPPASLARATCSNLAEVQLQDLGGNPVPPAGATAVTFLSDAPDAGLAFYADPGCLTLAGPVAVDGGGAAGVYLGAVGSGSTRVSATSGALTPAPPQTVAVAGPQGALAVAAPQADLEAGGCMALTVTRSGGAQPTLGTTPLAFTVSDAGLTVHADATCAAPALTQATIPEGTAATTVWLRGRSVPAPLSTLDLTVADPTSGCAPAVLTLRTYPLVRRGSCDIPANAAASSCNLGLPFDDVSRTLLVFQSTSGATTGASGLVECHLVVPDAGVSCSRQGSPNLTASVQWQTVSWGRGADDGGLTVQHLTGPLETAAVATQSVARGPADLRRAFLLFSASSNGTGSSRVEDLGIARLTDDGGVLVARTLETGSLPTGDYALQVVELGGARVDRGTTTGGSVAALGASCALPAPATSRLSALFSARLNAGGTTNDICSYGFRGAMTGTGLAIHRGVGASGSCVGLSVPELAYEFIEWPAGTLVDRPGSAVDAGFVELAVGATSGAWVPAQGVSAHRTLLYLPAQGAGGQSWGETDHTQMDLGAAAAVLTVSGGTVTVTRGQAANGPNAARFTPTALTFDP